VLAPPDRAVIERERLLLLLEFEVDAPLVPPDVDLVEMTGTRPRRLARRRPPKPVFRAAGHFHDISHCVMRPETQRFELGGSTGFNLGAGVNRPLPRFLGSGDPRSDAKLPVTFGNSRGIFLTRPSRNQTG
jgi:hypothetical protein